MPIASASSDNDGQTHRRLTLEEIQRDRIRSRARDREAAAQRATGERVLWNLKGLLQSARGYKSAVTERGAHEDAMSDLATEEPRVADRGVGETVRMAMAPFGLLAIAVIDICLIGAASQYILGLVYAAGDGVQPHWTLFVVGPCVLVFELAVASAVAHNAADHEHLDPEQPRPFNPALGLAWILAVAVPALAAATMLQAVDGQLTDSPVVRGLLVFAVVTLGVCIHIYVLFYGNRGRDAVIFLINRLKFGSHQRRANAAQARSLSLRDQSRDRLRGYHGAIAVHRATGAELPQHLLITTLDAVTINDAIGEVVVRTGDAPGQEGDAGATAGNPQTSVPPGGQSTAEPTPASAGGSNGAGNGERGGRRPAAGAAGAAPEDLSEELEYFRRAMRGRQADADGEIS